ncbi:MAG: homocysteine biosynthesis protein [archaeon]
MTKTYDEINEKIQNKEAVVLTADQFIEAVESKGLTDAAKEVDVVTTATFGPMCSSGVFINFGHSNPKIKAGGGEAYINEVPAYAGLAAVDLYIGATACQWNDPRNQIHPGKFAYGGGHVIEDLVRGKDLKLKVHAYGTNCYPRKELETWINIRDLNEAILFNPRNCYQNYNVAVNLSNKPIYTYMGTLKPNAGNINYSSAGQLSPLLKDPLYKTIGIGTRIWVAGAQGYITWHGTQHNPNAERNEHGVPMGGAGTVAVIADLKQADAKYLRGASLQGYGMSLALGIGVPIPILNEEVARFAALKDEDISAPVVDYSYDYPYCKPKHYGFATYAELKSGMVNVKGKDIPTSALSSYYCALEIAGKLKDEIDDGRFLLSKPAELLPGAGSDKKFKPLNHRETEKS